MGSTKKANKAKRRQWESCQGGPIDPWYGDWCNVRRYRARARDQRTAITPAQFRTMLRRGDTVEAILDRHTVSNNMPPAK